MIKASASITLAYQIDIVGTYWFYLLQPSTAAVPSAPSPAQATAFINNGTLPGNWKLAEPAYTEGSTNSLYIVELTRFSDNTGSWSSVSLSSSYEAAKIAYNKAHLTANLVGEINAPYKEVEWVESTGKQYVYLDWKPDFATWGFEADFLCRNANGTSGGNQWNESTNANGYGGVFGTRNASNVNEVMLHSYNTGCFSPGGNGRTTGIGWSVGQRVTMKYHGTTFTKPDGTTKTIARKSETADKPFHNMTVFAIHQGLRQAAYGGPYEPSSTRIYSLKFYEGNTLAVDLVGAIRKEDGVTGLYDKVSEHFYPAPGMLYGNEVGDIGHVDTVAEAMAKTNVKALVVNKNCSRMWEASVPFDRLEDGQKITVIYSYGTIASSNETARLPNWTDTTSNTQVYLKLTLSDGTENDWIPCYYSYNGRLTTHYAAGVPILLTYRENTIAQATATGAGSPIVRGFYADANYDTNTAYTQFANAVKAGTFGVKRYTLLMQDSKETWVSFVNEANNTGANKTVSTGGHLFGKLLYSAGGAEYAAGANTSTVYDAYPFDFRYSANITTSSLTAHKPVYLVGTMDNHGLFHLDTTTWWTQTLPSSADGKTYVYIGQAYSGYQIWLATENPAYQYYNGSFMKLEEIETLKAAKTATDYATDISGNGVFIHEKGGSTSLSSGTGVHISDAISILKNGLSYLWAGIQNTVSVVRIGLATAGHILLNSSGMEVYKDASGKVAELKYGATRTTGGGYDNGLYFTFGRRRNSSEIGYDSFALGDDVSATASYAHAEGKETAATGECSFSLGRATIAAGNNQLVIGDYNTPDAGKAFIIGHTSHGHDINDDYLAEWGEMADQDEIDAILESSRNNIFSVDWEGNLSCHNVGAEYTATKSVRITSAGIDTFADGASLTLPSGTYVLAATWCFETGSSSGARNMEIRITNSGGSILRNARQRILAGGNHYANLQAIFLGKLNAGTYKVRGSCSMQTNAAGSTTITAIRIA